MNMNSADFDRLTEKEKKRLGTYVHNSLHRVLKRIALAEQEIEQNLNKKGNDYEPECK